MLFISGWPAESFESSSNSQRGGRNEPTNVKLSGSKNL
jgi:hypothetical protein